MRYLTKSRFQLSMECPTKLFYTRKDEYANKKLDDAFLLALAEGGFQVGELAKKYHPGGHDITALDHEEAESETNRLFNEEKTILFEPAIRHQNLFIRIDVLVKNGRDLELIEVKAKSYDKLEGPESFMSKNGSLSSAWRSYFYDVAFQTHVLELAMPEYNVQPHLMLIDKHVRCPTDGLHQKFRVVRNTKSHKGVSVSSQLVSEDLAPQILIKVPVDEQVRFIRSGRDSDGLVNFGAEVKRLAASYEADQRIQTPIGSKCRSCEFGRKKEDIVDGKRSGFRECWTDALDWNESDFAEPNILDLWNYRKKDARIAEGRVKLKDIKKSDIGIKSKATPGLSTSKRQWLQVRKAIDRDTTPWVDAQGLQAEMATWSYPLHFIDFETAMVALPFNKGRHPYEGVAFQFSHHTVQEDGLVAHAGEYLNTERGVFPNYRMVRELKSQLENDDGTIFRYAHHENTFLCMIHAQLRTDSEPPADQKELMTFIRRITRPERNNTQQWSSARCMVDMLELVKSYCYLPFTNGSNSLKDVLPAILNSSTALQAKYSKPIYGAEGGIESHNFKDWQWARKENGRAIDPYELLPRMFDDATEKTQELISDESELREASAAMIAYARAQYEEMSEYEREQLFQALRKYCELDTLAMVMLYEGWMDLIGSN